MNVKGAGLILNEQFGEKIGLPDGVFVFYGEELEKRERAVQKLGELFSGKGYSRIETPVFEYLEALRIGCGEDIDEKALVLSDRSGELLALRYDWTTPIARFVASNGVKLPARLWYAGYVYRAEKQHTDVARQVFQVGIELVGEKEEGDFEVLELAVKSSKTTSDEFAFVLGNSKTYRWFAKKLSDLGFSDVLSPALHRAFRLKDASSIKEIVGSYSGEVADMMVSACRLVGGKETFDRAERIFGSDIVEEVVERWKAVKNLCDRVIVDWGLVRDFNYYTGMVFEVHTRKGLLLKGGRYDELMGKFGRNVPSAGFTMDLK